LALCTAWNFRSEGTMHIHGCKQTPPTPPTTSDEESSGSSDDASAKKKKGNRAMGKKKYPKALKYYSKAIKIDPKESTYHLNRSIANAALELWKDAENDAACALDLAGEPKSCKGHYQKGRAQLRRGKCEEAAETVRAGLAIFPTEGALIQLNKEIERAMKAKNEKKLKDLEEAAAKAALPSGPSGVRALLNQARSIYDEGRVEEAVAVLREALASSRVSGTEDTRRDEMSAFSLLGKASMQLRKWQDAAEAFESVVQLEEATFSMDNREEREALSNAYNNLGIARKNAGDMNGAVTALNQAYHRSTNGDDQVASAQAGQILQNVGQCLRAQKRTTEACKIFARALEIGQRLFGSDHASNALNHLCIARCYRDEGDVKQAIESYTKACEIWMQKDPETCLAEMPEVPNKERLASLQNQTRAELGMLVQAVEQMRQQAAAGGTAAAPATSAT